MQKDIVITNKTINSCTTNNLMFRTLFPCDTVCAKVSRLFIIRTCENIMVNNSLKKESIASKIILILT